MRAINLTIVLVLVIALGSCSSGRVTGPGVYYDDIYYVPGTSRDNVHQAFATVPSLTRAEQQELSEQRREYERSERAREQQDLRDFSGVQEEYAAILGDNNIEEVDTLLYYNEETGYWVEGFQGSQFDRDYAERLIRFHGPGIRIPYHSPFYSEVVYYNHYDWNVYVDGHYAYAFPTWTNRWYNNYHYHSWHRPYNRHFGWSYGYPYYGGYSGYGWGWNYYSPYYSWNYWHSPYSWHGYHSYYYHHPHYSAYPRGYYGSSAPVYEGMRGSVSSDYRGQGTRAEASQQAISRDSRIIGDSRSSSVDRTSAVDRSRTSESALARSNEPGREAARSTRDNTTGSRQSESSTRTRSSYTPTYSQPEGNTRPTYNRTTYTRVSNTSTRQAQTTGTVQGANSNTRQVQSSGRQVQQSSGREVQSSGTTTRQPSRNIQSAPARSTTTTPATRQTATPTRQSSSPASYQRGSSSAPTRSNVQSAPARTSTPARSTAPSSTRSVAPTRSSSTSTPAVSSGSSGSSSRGSSTGTSSRGGSSSRSGGGRR